MSEKINAAEAVRASIRHFKQVSDFADLLETVGKLENMEAETKARIVKLGEDEKQADKEAKEAKERCKKEQAKADTLMASTVQDADRITNLAKSEADALVKKSKDKSKALEDKAANNIAMREESARVQLNEAQTKLDGLYSQIAEAAKELENKQQLLKDVNTSIDLAKAKVAGLFNT